MARDKVVSVRLTDDEFARVTALGGPTKVLRRRLLNPPAAAPTRWPITAAAGRVSMVWHDGTVGQQWPALVTGMA